MICSIARNTADGLPDIPPLYELKYGRTTYNTTCLNDWNSIILTVVKADLHSRAEIADLYLETLRLQSFYRVRFSSTMYTD